MTERALRVIDTGVRGGRANMAYDQALVDLHRAGAIPDTLRFLAFEPCVLLGRHQCVSREVDVAFCTGHGIEIGRRLTGGGALYLDRQQLGWEIVCRRQRLPAPSLAAYATLLCEAAAAGLAALGVAARFRPRNDIEVDGRKLGGTGGFFDGDTLFYQGTVLLDTDAGTMARALRLPADKAARHGLPLAADRVVGLRELLGSAPAPETIKAALAAALAAVFDAVPVAEGVGELETAAAARCLAEELGQDAFVFGLDVPLGHGYASATRHWPGGTVTVHARCARRRPAALERIFVTGDFFVSPPRIVRDLEAALRDTPLAEVEASVAAFFRVQRPEILSITPAELAATVRAALPAQ